MLSVGEMCHDLLRGHSLYLDLQRCESSYSHHRLWRHVANLLKNPYWINPATAYMAQYVGDISHYCQTNIISTPGGGLNWNTGGQEFDTDHYNIIARDNAGFC
jgi:hypothetical protein